ncbi:MAG TPA: hypothetical protein PLV45_09565 [bacterium]|nr:hypothetical protein [bacterium]
MKHRPEHTSLFPSWRTLAPLGLLIGMLWICVLYADLASFRGTVSLRSAIHVIKYIALIAGLLSIGLTVIRPLKIIGIRAAAVALVFFLFCISESAVANAVWTHWTAETLSAGNRIIAALDEYYAHNGDYPDSLLDLVPEYLKSIPELQYRYRYQGFGYSSTGWTFRLEFDVAGLTHCVYTAGPRSAQWQCSETSY